MGNISYVCMLDDDVLLAPDFLGKIVCFLTSNQGTRYGGVAGYEMVKSGQHFEHLEEIYNCLGIFDGELRPGRWLYCGEWLELSRLQPTDGIYSTEFLPGGLTVWRMAVFDRFLPPAQLTGFRGAEDKHLSLRVATVFRLGILGEARCWHYHVPGGPRLNKFMTAYGLMRNKAIILRDCDPNPTARRYLAFLGFNLLHLTVRLFVMVARIELHQVPDFLGSLLGWAHCLLIPPKPTGDALGV